MPEPIMMMVPARKSEAGAKLEYLLDFKNSNCMMHLHELEKKGDDLKAMLIEERRQLEYTI